MITHDPEIAEHAHRSIWIRDGLIQEEGTTAERDTA
jgi:ABC-type lipoprotein export system ATPase subunit